MELSRERLDRLVKAKAFRDPSLSLPAVSINGARLHFREAGDPCRPLVVVLHGGPGWDMSYLEGMLDLADEYHVVLYDQRGCGLSERVPSSALTMEAHIADLDGIIDRFRDQGDVFLLGHSWGGMLATAYAAHHPEKVRAAVLAEPGFLTPALFDQYLKRTGKMGTTCSTDTRRNL